MHGRPHPNRRSAAHVETLHEVSRRYASGRMEVSLSSQPSRAARKLCPSVAELFLPGATNPFREKIAGRERLELPPGFLAMARSPF